ncbi:MAG: hypothetical protein JXR96_28570 [Deltaproteobacteria bacterium]|nr:hypothetical protein [Deltaproteobacteria bacterium]
MPAPPTAPRSTFAGLLLLSAATLCLEVCLTRILSVTLWYHFAFMVVSTALFGLGFAGVALALRKRPQEVSARLLARAAAATPIAFGAGFLLFNAIPYEPFSLASDAWQWLWMPLSYLSVTLPFFFSGLTISALLTRHARAVHRLYLFDLAGAGAGSLAVIALLPGLGGLGTVFGAAMLAACGAACIALESSRRLAAGAGLAALAIAALVPFADAWIPLRISSNKAVGDPAQGGRTVAELLGDPQHRLLTAWNTLSRIDVVAFRDRRGGEHRHVLIDAGTAMTRLAHPEGPIEQLGPTRTEESYFVQLFEHPSVLVIGSGGGREVLIALRNGASRVLGVEINPAINALLLERMADFTGGLAADPRVEIRTDEARSFLRRLDERFELISCPHTISNASLASGSLSLAENHLMTAEAFEDYLAHLSDDGLLFITRPEAHLPRLFSTARAIFALRGEQGFERSVMAYRARSRGLAFYAGFALRRRPFTPAEVDRFAAVLEQRGLQPLYLPGRDSACRPPYPELARAPDPRTVAVPFPAILEPATDDRPFFNRRVPLAELRWSDLAGVFDRRTDGRQALEDRPVAEASLLVLLIETGIIGLAFILLPLAVFRRRNLAGEGRLRTLAAFGLLGLAYITVEVGFIQRFTLYLGRPVLVFSTVLGTLLVASGLGSSFARRFSAARAPVFAGLVAAAIAAATVLVTAPLLAGTLAWPAWARISLSVLLLAPSGFVMGMPFPLLIRRLDATHPERIPWAWGVNGFASVVGSIGAVLLGMTLGYTAVLLFGVGFYGLAAVSALGFSGDLPSPNASG